MLGIGECSAGGIQKPQRAYCSELGAEPFSYTSDRSHGGCRLSPHFEDLMSMSFVTATATGTATSAEGAHISQFSVLTPGAPNATGPQ